MKWLDEQSAESVVYVCFGNKTETRKEQIKGIANGLIECGYKFLWVVKLKKVDKEEEEELEGVLGNELMRKVEEKGMVVKTWVDQMEILGHPAVGGFVTHGGWNSLVEAVWHGVPILSWPHNGDQKICSEAVQMCGVGIWAEEWGWGSLETVVNGEEIAKAIKEMMSNVSLRIKAKEMKDAARKAAGIGGSCEVKIKRQIEEWTVEEGS